MMLTCQQIENRLRSSFETLDEANPIFVTHEDFLCEVDKIVKELFGGNTVVFPGRNPRSPETDGLHNRYGQEDANPLGWHRNAHKIVAFL